MKRKLLFLLFAFTALLAQSQNAELKRWAETLSGTTISASKTTKPSAPTNMDLFNKYTKISNNYQYGAIGTGSLSAGLLLGFACVKDRYEINEDGDSKMTNKSKYLLAGGCVTLFSAIILQIKAIEYKTKANNHLRLQLTQSGAGLAFVF